MFFRSLSPSFFLSFSLWSVHRLTHSSSKTSSCSLIKPPPDVIIVVSVRLTIRREVGWDGISSFSGSDGSFDGMQLEHFGPTSSDVDTSLQQLLWTAARPSEASAPDLCRLAASSSVLRVLCGTRNQHFKSDAQMVTKSSVQDGSNWESVVCSNAVLHHLKLTGLWFSCWWCWLSWGNCI